MSKQYLSRKDIRLDGVDLEKDYPLLTPSMGSGKTYFVFTDELRKVYENHSNRKIDIVIYCSPTTGLKEQTLLDYVYNSVLFDEQDLFNPDTTDKRIRVCCMSRIAQILKSNIVRPQVNYLIVMDEFDTYANWTMCHEDKLYLWDWIESNKDNLQFCGITATPTLLTKYVNGINFVDTTPNYPITQRVNKIRIWPKTHIDTICKNINAKPNNKILIYTRSAKKCVALSRRIENSGFLVSSYNEDIDKETGKKIKDLMAEQMAADDGEIKKPLLDYVMSRAKLPDNMNVLIINDAYAAGINIHDEKVKHVIAESVEVDTIKQVMGRVRHDIKTLNVCYNFKEKDRLIKQIDRANSLYRGETTPAEVYKAEQEIIETWKGDSKNLPISILTYKSNYDNKVKINPFAHGFYTYRAETYNRLLLPSQARLVYSSLRAYSDNDIEWLSQATINMFREHGNNQSKINNIDLSEWMGRKLFTEDKKELVAQLKLRNGQGRVSSWPTAKKYLIELGYEIKESKTYRNGKQCRYAQINRKGE